MQIVPMDTAKLIFFRDEGFYISGEDFENMVRMRKERIDTQRFFIPDGTTVQDHFASLGLELTVGGEVCPREMGVHVGPMNAGDAKLTELFGKNWHEYEGWTAAS